MNDLDPRLRGDDEIGINQQSPTLWRIAMMQKAFEKSENIAVFYGVVIFFVFHFGMLFLFNVV